MSDVGKYEGVLVFKGKKPINLKHIELMRKVNQENKQAIAAQEEREKNETSQTQKQEPEGEPEQIFSKGRII
jgi:hypothetical protein